MAKWEIRKFDGLEEKERWEAPGNLSEKEIVEILKRLACRSLSEVNIISSSLRANHKDRTAFLDRIGHGAEIQIGESRYYAARIVNSDTSKERPAQNAKTCPECGHVFKDNGWGGIDSHWRSKHEDVMCYEEAWPLLEAGTYTNMQSNVSINDWLFE